MNSERFVGTVVWYNKRGTEADKGTVERAIHRGDDWTMDARSGAGVYAITLRAGADGKLRGTWDLDRGARHGPADLRIVPRDDADEPTIVLGHWGTGVDTWLCVLHPVESFDARTSDD
jgi:hypothetical protein